MKMMKFFLLAAAAVAAISCAKENLPVENENPVPEVELVPMTFTATADNGEADTKVFYDGQTKTTQWKSGDKIAVISSNGTASTFEAVEVSEDGKTAVFEGLSENAETYYAVSPASAYKGDGKEVLNGTLYVNIPEVQNAVAGSFDPAAFVSVATNNGGTLSFKNSCTVVKFRLNEADNVKSVRFTANEVTNLAGTQNVYTTNIPVHSWGDPFTGRSAFNMITLNAPNEGFVADTDYYMTMRPQTMAKGINLYIEYEDGVRIRKGSSSFAAPINTIRDLKALDAVTLEDITPYDSYQMGFDLVVGDKVYNKAINGDAVKVTADGTSMYTAFNKGGIRFLDPAADGAIVLHSNVAVSADAILVGNVSSGKVLVNMNGRNVNHTAKTVALKNLELDAATNTNYVFANNNATADADAFILDNCSVTGLAKPLWYVNVETYSCKSIILADTDVQLDGGANIIDLAKTKSSGNEQIVIENCLFYNSTDNTTARIINNSSNISSTASLRFNNNTVFNLHSGVNAGIVHMAGAATVDFKNNLFDFCALNDVTDDGKFEYVVRIWKNTPEYNVENNHYWRRDNNTVESDKLAAYGNGNAIVYAKTAEAAITSGKYPFTSNIPGAGATR